MKSPPPEECFVHVGLTPVSLSTSRVPPDHSYLPLPMNACRRVVQVAISRQYLVPKARREHGMDKVQLFDRQRYPCTEFAAAFSLTYVGAKHPQSRFKVPSPPLVFGWRLKPCLWICLDNSLRLQEA